MFTQLLGAAATVYGVLGALKTLLQARQMLTRRTSREVSARFLASYAGGYAIWLTYGLSTGSLPLIVVDTVGLLCGGLTLAPSPRLYAEYLGQGDFDKPRNYPYSTIERADLVEALWTAHDVISTVAVSFDYSSLVVMELLARRLDRRAAGDPEGTRISGVLLVNGGLFADSHSHPWRTTPFMKTRLGGLALARNQERPASAARVLRASRMWSRGYRVSDEEVGDMYDVLARHGGMRFLHDGAGFVDEHKRNAARWDLARLTAALGNELTWDIAGSALDPFESRQIRAARHRLDQALVRIHDLPGGHLTTTEHPNLLASLIRMLPQLRPDGPSHLVSPEGNQPS